MKETACWKAKVKNQHPPSPFHQRMCSVVMYARRAEIQEQARHVLAIKGFMPEITDPEQRYDKAIEVVCMVWFFVGPQEWPTKKQAILFRCMVCGKEYKTVEESNACEKNHGL